MTSSRLLSNRYELGETLGYGGMSEVHRGKDVRLGRDVAVKVLRADLARDPQFQERFRREAQNAAALNHPAIVAVYDTGETRTDYGPLPYIVMEYVDGRTLRDIVKSEGPLPPKRAMEVMADVSAALDFSHRHGIVHRDVKPANIMITKTGAVKVMDFGIARAVSDGQAAVTQTAAVIGTAQYLSPEQARGEPVDARSDVYAAGCVLFELLTGEPPFTGDSPVAVAYQHVREDPKPPSALNPRVPPSLDAIVLKAMAKGPANRYQSAAEMRGDLVRVLSGQRPAAPMVMTDADRTSLMGQGRTEVMTGGRHRPQAIASEYDDYDDYDPDADARRKRRGWLIALAVIGAIIVIALLAWLLPKAFGNNDNPNAGKIAVPNVVDQLQPQAIQAINAANLVPRVVSVTCAPQGTANAQCTTEQVGHVIRTDPASGSLLSTGGQVSLFVGAQAAPVKVPDLTGKTPAEAQQALQAAHLTLAPNPGSQPVTDQGQIGKVVGQNPSAGGSAQPGSSVSITLGAQPQTLAVPDERGKSFDDAKADLNDKGFSSVSQDTTSSDKPAGTVVEMNPAQDTQVAPNSKITLIVSDGSQQQITVPSLQGLSQSQAKQSLKNLGWSGNFNVNTVPTFDPTQDGLIKEQNPGQGTQIDKNQTVFVTVQRFVGGSPTTTTGNGGGQGGGGGPFG
ncbi:MAG TPA: Stk1 family PASTA domain-containing Ser/Thr kinase [Pseudonocardiaceae bacterium]|jgi:serine/threonine-protein kinase|nr:Stk1 family PASTA domain-containing Ser/Thr kinase [Pseudonocardiaceae bacterium]